MKKLVINIYLIILNFVWKKKKNLTSFNTNHKIEFIYETTKSDAVVESPRRLSKQVVGKQASAEKNPKTRIKEQLDHHSGIG